MRHTLITGSNRGIGLAFVQEYLKQDDTFIFATCRNPDPASELNTLANVHKDRLQVIQLHEAVQWNR